MKLLLTVAAVEDMDIEQMDVKTAFLIPTLNKQKGSKIQRKRGSSRPIRPCTD
jgi:hypothetical protein